MNKLREILNEVYGAILRPEQTGKEVIDQALQQIRELMPSEERIVKKISESKIIKFTKKIERYCAKLEKRQFDDPEDKWLSKKIEELAKAISKAIETNLFGEEK